MPELTNPFKLIPDRKLSKQELVATIRQAVIAEHDAAAQYRLQAAINLSTVGLTGSYAQGHLIRPEGCSDQAKVVELRTKPRKKWIPLLSTN